MEEGHPSQVSLNGSTKSAKFSTARFDGHTEGHLNCIALRHGWRRSFSIPPSGPKSLETLDYATFQAILELNTIRLRPLALRIYIEHPPQSGTFTKVRPWKDDGSLQSILTKQYFVERSKTGAICLLEVRDGSDREDTHSVRSLAMGSGNKIMNGGRQTKEWLKTHVPRRKKDDFLDDDDEEEEEGTPSPPKKSPSRFGALMYAFGLSSNAPAPPSKTPQEVQEERVAEEQELKKRGWLPPALRRMTSRRSQQSNSQKSMRSLRGNPFFGRSERDALLFRSRSNNGSKRERYDSDPRAPLGSEHDGSALGMIADEDLEGVEDYNGYEYEPRVTEWTSAPPADRISENGNDAEGDADSRSKRPTSGRAWFRMFGAGGNTAQATADVHAEDEDPFDDGEEMRSVASSDSKRRGKGKKKDKKKDKGKGKGKAVEFTGAEVVRQPMDAFPDGTVPDTEVD